MNDEYEEQKKKLEELGHYLKGQMPDGMGFTVLMFDYGPNGHMYYLSSAVRQDMIKSMQEFLRSQTDETNPVNDEENTSQ